MATFLKQEAAQNLDKELMSSPGFSVDQLMELAGLSVACSVAKEYAPAEFGSVIIVAGPGNNGGDGLVAARHLFHFGYKDICIVYPKRGRSDEAKRLFGNLVAQCEQLGIPVVESFPEGKYDLLIDAVFGFSFKGDLRAPFDDVLKRMSALDCPCVSIDVPSGWDVSEGNVSGLGIMPEMLVSLTAPKECARLFKGPHHYLGGRFVPPHLARKYGFEVPTYPGAEQCVKLSE